MKLKITKKRYFNLLVLLSFQSALIFAQVVDIDGNSYQTVVIGTQEWMAENLNTTKFSNGDPIPNVTDINAYYSYGAPAWAYYANNASNGAIYGKLYNGFVAEDNRNCCPDGWHVPTDADWTTLSDYMGGEAVAGDKLKNSTVWNGTDDVGFNAMPGGIRYALAGDIQEGTLFGQGYWWSSDRNPANTNQIFFYRINTYNPNLYREAQPYTLGMSIRCIKNSSLGLNENSTGFQKSFVYPNPFNSKATLVLNNNFNGDLTIKIYSSTGQLVKEIFESNKSLITINSDGLSKGFYLYTVKSSDNRSSHGKFVIK